jgi:hypothetical protein
VIHGNVVLNILSTCLARRYGRIRSAATLHQADRSLATVLHDRLRFRSLDQEIWYGILDLLFTVEKQQFNRRPSPGRVMNLAPLPCLCVTDAEHRGPRVGHRNLAHDRFAEIHARSRRWSHARVWRRGHVWPRPVHHTRSRNWWRQPEAPTEGEQGPRRKSCSCLDEARSMEAHAPARITATAAPWLHLHRVAMGPGATRNAEN